MIRTKLTHRLWTRLDDSFTKLLLTDCKKKKLKPAEMIRHIVEEYYFDIKRSQENR